MFVSVTTRVSWCVCVCARAYSVSVDEPQAARAGPNPLLFDVVEHVDEQRAVHLVGQVDGRVTLETRREEDRQERTERHGSPLTVH